MNWGYLALATGLVAFIVGNLLADRASERLPWMCVIMIVEWIVIGIIWLFYMAFTG